MEMEMFYVCACILMNFLCSFVLDRIRRTAGALMHIDSPHRTGGIQNGDLVRSPYAVQ